MIVRKFSRGKITLSKLYFERKKSGRYRKDRKIAYRRQMRNKIKIVTVLKKIYTNKRK